MSTKIYIDPGHGGKDPGAVGIDGINESTITLAVAKCLQTELKRQGFSVKMSRTTDTYKSLAERTSEANSWGADIVVSIHCNAFEDSSANGTETYVYKYGYKSSLLANDVQINLVSTLGTKNRGVKEGNLAMVRDTVAPAILVELAFITNKTDCAKVDNANEQKKCAISICKGICSYLGITYTKEENKMEKDYKGHWAEDAIEEMVKNKIMVGDGKGTFRPDDGITRAEVAKTIYNLLKYLGK